MGRWCCCPIRTRSLVAEGQALVTACIRRGRPGPYQLQAAINAVHSDASTAAETDWSQILWLYDQLVTMAPTAVVALNRAVALAEVHGPAAGLDAADALEPDLAGYHLFHATRADLLRRLGREAEAVDAYDAALALVTNAAERRFLEDRRRSLAVADLPTQEQHAAFVESLADDPDLATA